MSRSRLPYSRADEMEMWLYLYEQLRKGVPAASEPKGLKIWKMFAEESKCGRSADSLTSRFRKSMLNRLYDANLPCHKMMFLYRELQLSINADVKVILELKYGIKIELNSKGILKSFKRVGHVVPEAPVNQATSSQVAPSSPPSQCQQVEQEHDNVQQAESRLGNNQGGISSPSSPPNERADMEASPEGISTSSVWATPSSIDFTRQIRQVEDESRLKARREAMNANINNGCAGDRNDDEDREDGSLQSTFMDSLRDSLDRMQNNEPQEDEAPDVDHQEVTSSNPRSADVEVEDILHDAPEQGPAELRKTHLNKEIEDPIVVSTTSDSCQKALAHLCNVYGLQEPLQDQFAWRRSEEVLFLTDRWKSKIEEIIGSYELSPESVNSIRSSIMAMQAQFLTESQIKENYLNSLIDLKNFVKKHLDLLHREYCPPKTQRKPIVTRNPDGEYSFHFRHSYEQISLSVRKEEVEKFTSQITDSIHDALVIITLEHLQLLEDQTAAISKDVGDYVTGMAEVREALHECLF